MKSPKESNDGFDLYNRFSNFFMPLRTKYLEFDNWLTPVDTRMNISPVDTCFSNEVDTFAC